MFTLPRLHSLEQEIKKSRFRAVALPLTTEAEAKSLLAAHGDATATHNCWAWRLGQAYRSSDDGEPAGTAGRPILQAIDGQDLDGVLVIVSRWFGGILLGAGGLIRAYGGTASACLRAAEKEAVIARVPLTLRVAFADLARVKARLQACADTLLIAETFTATGADIALAVPVQAASAIEAMIADLTAGRAWRVDPA